MSDVSDTSEWRYHLCGGHNIFEVQGNAAVQQRENAGKHVLHLPSGEVVVHISVCVWGGGGRVEWVGWW